MFVTAGAEALMAKAAATESRLAELQGVINAAHGALVEVAAAVLEEQAGDPFGTHTPAGYLAWRTGVSPARAGELIRLAKRRHELPVCVAALVAGELTIESGVGDRSSRPRRV